MFVCVNSFNKFKRQTFRGSIDRKMGELPCLRRSFSQPSGGLREAKEVNSATLSLAFS